jgi:hypothetical protein
MGTVTTTLGQEAESIFTDLGYAVTPEGSGFRAERKWRVVRVTPMAEPASPPDSGELRCFVTWKENVSALERRLERESPDYEWAIIGVAGDDYVVSPESSTREP